MADHFPRTSQYNYLFMRFDLLSVFLLFGALQSIIFMAGLWRRGTPRPPTFWLLLALLGGISIILTHHGIFANLSDENSWKYTFIGFSAAAWLLVPPGLYLYVKSLLEEPFRWQHYYWLYFSVSGYHLLSWLLSILGINYGFYLLFANHQELYLFAWVASYLLIGFCFGILTLLLLNESRSGRLAARLQWLRHYVIGFIAATVIAALVLIYLITKGIYSEQFEYSLLIIYEVFVLALAYQSIRRSAYSAWLANRLYGITALPKRELKQLNARLENYMTESSPYLNPNLKLIDLAKGCEINENELSQIFTQYLNTSFYHYVNQYRLANFEENLTNEGLARLTINGLATESGFKSKTSLYKVFREKHGTTPVVYLKQMAD